MQDQNKQLNTVQTGYYLKKTEKLVTALYLLSNFLSDKEPIKWRLRELGADLLSQSMSVSLSKQIISLLQVAHIAGLISEMNFNIIKFEFELLIQKAEQAEKEGSMGLVLPEDFFTLPEVHEPMSAVSKGQNLVSNRMSVKTVEPKQKDKPNRQSIIIGLLKEGKELGIKDFASAIQGCSEKTIQRELVLMAYKGQIKKSGEKRR